MTAEQFTYWLQGFMEINDPETLTRRETQIIKDHLALVFKKETPNRIVSIPNTPQPYVTSPYPDWINKPTVYCSTDTSTTGNIIC